MKRKLPQIIKDVGFDFRWDNSKVWKRNVPVEVMNITELEWHFDIPFWNKSGGYYDLSPNDVLQNPALYPEEFQRILNANITYPLDIMYWKNRWLMLDGLHRLVKAKFLKQQSVNVRKIPQSDIPKILTT